MADLEISLLPKNEESGRVAPASASVNGTRLAKNAAFNFAGQILPLLAGILLIPFIVRGIGPDRFGMLGIIWVIFGYFSLMDLGIGRATTKFLAEWLAKGETERIPETVWNSIILQVLLGLLGGAIMAALTPMLVDRVLKTPVYLVGEARTSFYILAAALPVILAMNGLRAVLEGCQRFDISNLLRIPSNTVAFVIPAVAIAVGLRLPGMVLWMAISRLGFTFAHAHYCGRILPCVKTRPRLHFNAILPLLSFGGWVSVSTAVSPILLWMDRFVIGALLSVAMVGYYTAPYEAVTKLWMIPISLMTTVYPACSALGTERMRDLQILYSRLIKYLFCSLAPVTLIVVIFARPIMAGWLGSRFADESSVPLQFLAIGVFINCFIHVPYSFLQALGRPAVAAKVFLLELIPYGLLLWWMVKHYGLTGAAAAWSIRAAIEVLLLLWIARRVFSLSVVLGVDRSMRTGFAAFTVTAVGVYATHFLLRRTIVADAGICAVWMTGFVLAVWKWVLDQADRASLLAVVGPLGRVIGKPSDIAHAD